MKLLDRYVAEVGKSLPRKQRADIEKEIRSTLLDMLEERDQASVKDEAAVIALLKEYGEPRKVAESYIGPRYLIGPRLYPTFELIVKIVMACVLGAGLLGYGVSASITKSFAGTEFFSFLGQFWLGLLGGVMNAFGSMVIVFSILERVVPAKEFEKERIMQGHLRFRLRPCRESGLCWIVQIFLHWLPTTLQPAREQIISSIPSPTGKRQ